MLVDVVELFRDGVRLSHEEARAQMPVRGTLTIDKAMGWQSIELAPLTAMIVPIQLEPLGRARILYLRGRNLVLHGLQLGPNGAKKRNGSAHEQIWWCRIVRDEDPDQAAGPRQRAARAADPSRASSADQTSQLAEEPAELER